VKIADDGIHALVKVLADTLDVRSLPSSLHLIDMGTWRDEMAVEVRQFGVEARELELRGGRKPIHGAKKDAGTSAVHCYGSGGMGLRLDFIFNGANEDRVFDDGNDDAASGKVYDDLFGGHILNLLRGSWRRAKQEGDC